MNNICFVIVVYHSAIHSFCFLFCVSSYIIPILNIGKERLHHWCNCSILILSAVDGGFEPCPVKPKTIKLVFVASLLSTSLRSKIKDWLARNQDNVSERSYMSTCLLLFGLANAGTKQMSS